MNEQRAAELVSRVLALVREYDAQRDSAGEPAARRHIERVHNEEIFRLIWNTLYEMEHA
jgi:hypothetical protein